MQRKLADGLDVELSSLIRLYEERHEDAHIPLALRGSVRLSEATGRERLLSTDQRWAAEQ